MRLGSLTMLIPNIVPQLVSVLALLGCLPPDCRSPEIEVFISENYFWSIIQNIDVQFFDNYQFRPVFGQFFLKIIK